MHQCHDDATPVPDNLKRPTGSDQLQTLHCRSISPTRKIMNQSPVILNNVAKLSQSQDNDHVLFQIKMKFLTSF